MSEWVAWLNDSIFGTVETPQQKLRRYGREIQRAERRMDEEIIRLRNSNSQLQVDVQRLVRQQQNAAAREIARSIVRQRADVAKLYRMKGVLQSTRSTISTNSTVQQMSEAMRNSVRALYVANKTMPGEAMQQLVVEFARQVDIMQTKQELLDEAAANASSDTLDEMGDEPDEDTAIAQVLSQAADSIAMSLPSLSTSAHASSATTRASVAPSASSAAAAAAAAASQDEHGDGSP